MHDQLYKELTAMKRKNKTEQACTENAISRREFMTRMALLSSFSLTYPAAVLAQRRSAVQEQALEDWLQQSDWQTLAQVQEVLFPADKDSPGATDIGAISYLYRAIQNPGADGEDKDFIFRGIGWLDDLCQQQHNKSFTELSAVQQEAIITEITKSRAGRNWVSTLLTYILEALLMDPVYGGNRNGIGWSWLQHQPGYPAPPADKTWDRLRQRFYKA